MKRKYRCSFCNKEFTRESWYKKHTCEKKRRFLDRNNIHYISGHRLFNHWQSVTGLLRLGKTKTFEEFCKSPYFKSFVELAQFISDNHIVSGYKYVEWLVENDIKEVAWKRKSGLEKYRDYVRRSEQPENQVDDTCKFILDWCEEKETTPEMFFKRITPGQALTMVRRNQLSPWVLLCYDPSVDNLIPRFEGEVLFALDDHIKINYWLNKIETDEVSVNKVKVRCQELLDDGRDT